MDGMGDPVVAGGFPGQATACTAHPTEKITTSHLARRFGLQSAFLLNRLVGRGFVELRDGRKYLTNTGKQAGGEEVTRRSKGRFIVWPSDLLLRILE